ncbi:mevalonate kinase family protein [Neolewinella agarilytica]|uniref:mevalonate kinase n=1 Tax=Neolewinella agarilytica TaxID=478744 RepID=A0A1H9F4R4_9BACT|nr:hypothetical protein [Neolewinella agarilytica]SEQ32956.1 mevalonate kinase [Neolewinella agarilytica]
MSRSYSAKILLFGEHTVLRGGRGLAVPYDKLSLRWTKGTPDERLLAFADYLKVAISPELLDAGALEDQLLADWRLEGNIPVGYGLGSSGAVCAAIWSRFATSRGFGLRGEALRDVLARMEQHFHGSSSGTDPLICYLNQPVSLGGGQPPKPVELPEGWNKRFFLVDTGIERKASDYIQKFTQRYDEEPNFKAATDAGWLEPANRCIEALLNNDQDALTTNWRTISQFQLRELPGFIPTSFHERWASKGYLLKICGAGGGGVLLGYALERGVTERALGKVFWL